MYIRKIKRKYNSMWFGELEYEYYYLVESYRNEQGQPRQRKLLYLGKYKPTLEKAIQEYERSRDQ
jgi:hypothetical protein